MRGLLPLLLLLALLPALPRPAAALGPLPVPTPSLPPLPVSAPPPRQGAPPVPAVPAAPVPANPVTAPLLPSQQAQPGAPPPPQQQSPQPQPQPQAQPQAYTPSPDEQSSLPPEAGRYDLERQQYWLDRQSSQLDSSLGPQAIEFGGGSGRFAWPVQLVGRRPPHLTQGFGCTDVPGEPYNPTCASRRWHTGIDIGVPIGTPVYAADNGVVHLVPSDQGYGNHVVLAHGNGWLSLYGHLSRFAAGEGQVVHRGDLIGWSGSTGFSTGPHLHFEIRHDRDYQDPCAFLDPTC